MPDPTPPVRWQMNTTDLTQFDPVIAHLCCWCCYYSYYVNANNWYSSFLDAKNIQRVPFDQPTGRPQGWIFELPECNIVVFGGTSDYSQLYGLLRDMKYSLLSNTGGSIVVGLPYALHVANILTGYGSTLASIMRNKKTIFTGTSMGGAIVAALQVALKAVPDAFRLPSVAYTFGCPKVGNANFTALTLDNFNLVVPGDIVPKLPPAGYARFGSSSDTPPTLTVSPLDPFKRHGRLVYLDSGGKLDIQEPGAKLAPEDAPVEWDVSRLATNILSGQFLADNGNTVSSWWNKGIQYHMTSLYLRLLEQAIPTLNGAKPELDTDGKKDEDQLPVQVLSTADFQLIPPPAPTPLATTGAVPFTKRTKH